MWPFKSTDTLEESGMFAGFTDWHCHILPGVDDGMREMEHSLEALSRLEQAGFKKIWLTPHIMEDYPNTTQGLRERYEELKGAYSGGIDLRLASENMLDPLFEERCKTGDFLPIGDEGKYLLVETSYVNPPYGMDDMIENVYQAGYIPLLAHPERYRYMEERDYHKWRDMGVKFQTNFMSVVGGYGEVARKKAEWLLKEDMIEACASDLHRIDMFEIYRKKSPSKQKFMDQLLDIARNPRIS